MTPTGLVVGALVVAAGACCGQGLRRSRRARVRGRLAPRPLHCRRRRWLPPPPSWLAKALTDAAAPLDVDRAWASWLGAGLLVVMVGAAAGGPLLAALLMPVAVLGPRLLLHTH